MSFFLVIPMDSASIKMQLSSISMKTERHEMIMVADYDDLANYGELPSEQVNTSYFKFMTFVYFLDTGVLASYRYSNCSYFRILFRMAIKSVDFV